MASIVNSAHKKRTTEGENLRELTLVVLDEVKSGDWGVACKAFATGDVKARAGKYTGWRRPTRCT
jgi:hypothetical protein